jgi:hypothetical protein
MPFDAESLARNSLNLDLATPVTAPVTSGRCLNTQSTYTPTPPRTTRLKMTLHAVAPVEGDADNPLTRCTFGAVYSPNPTEEDGVFGKYTPYGCLTYNVRSDIAQGLQVGQAYYVDITPVAS